MILLSIEICCKLVKKVTSFSLKYRLKGTFAFNFCLSITNFVFDNLFFVEACFSNFCKSGGLPLRVPTHIEKNKKVYFFIKRLTYRCKFFRHTDSLKEFFLVN